MLSEIFQETAINNASSWMEYSVVSGKMETRRNSVP
jgi:hypothetical protein